MVGTKVAKFENEDVVQIRHIRNTVFTNEQNVDEDIDFDGQDVHATHILIEKDGEYVGTGRMLKDGHIGRIAILKSSRGLGFGIMVVFGLIAEAENQKLKRVYLGAQQQAVGFYRKLGFTEYGEPYMEAGINHIHMEKFI